MLAYPFRFGVDSRCVTVESESSPGRAQRIGQLVMTQKGERPLAPAFGMRSIAWNRLTLAEVRRGVAVFGPFDVELAAIDTYVDELTQRLVILFADGDR